MPKSREQAAFAPFGNDVKEARKALGITRRELAEMVNIDPRYLANIENCGNLPSLPIFYELVTICKLPVERYFYPEIGDERKSPERERTIMKLNLCPEKYLSIIESALDATIKIDEPKKD